MKHQSPDETLRPRKTRAKQNKFWSKIEEDCTRKHPHFLQSLVLSHPSLTRTERYICAMLRLDMVSIEIAEVLSTSEDNINNHRLRIRRKLGLNGHKHDLVHFLSRL